MPTTTKKSLNEMVTQADLDWNVSRFSELDFPSRVFKPDAALPELLKLCALISWEIINFYS